VASAYLYELKFDGYRILAVRTGRELRLFSRSGQDWTSAFQAVADDARLMKAKEFVIDGEVCALDERGVPSFQLLQNRMGRAPALAYFVFDLLWADGDDLRHLPLEDHHERLKQLVGKHSRPPMERFITPGRPGTGFSNETRKTLGKLLEAVHTDEPPVADAPSFGGIARWSCPRHVAEVAFSEWTAARGSRTALSSVARCSRLPAAHASSPHASPTSPHCETVRSGVGLTATHDGVLDDEHNHRTHHGDEHAPDIEAIDAGCADGIEEKPTNDRADDAEDDVEDRALARLVDDFAGDES
jgi:ATP-dependent DNA ligase